MKRPCPVCLQEIVVRQDGRLKAHRLRRVGGKRQVPCDGSWSLTAVEEEEVA